MPEFWKNYKVYMVYMCFTLSDNSLVQTEVCVCDDTFGIAVSRVQLVH